MSFLRDGVESTKRLAESTRPRSHRAQAQEPGMSVEALESGLLFVHAGIVELCASLQRAQRGVRSLDVDGDEPPMPPSLLLRQVIELQECRDELLASLQRIRTQLLSAG